MDRPGPRLLGAGGEVGLQAEGVEADAGELVETALILAGGCEQFGGIRRIEVDEFGFEFGVEEDRVRRSDERLSSALRDRRSSTASSTLKT